MGVVWFTAARRVARVPEVTTQRTRTAVDELADAHFDRSLQMSPMFLTDMGSTERQDEYDDLSPAGIEAQVQLSRETLAALDSLQPADEVDKVTIAAMRERLGLEVESHEAGLSLLNLNGIASFWHAIRAVYDAMPTDTDEQWLTIARRLNVVPTAVEQAFESTSAAIERGLLPARRQVNLLAEQLGQWSADGGFFDELAASAPETVREQVSAGAQVAKQSYADSATRLREQVAPLSTEVDGVGIDRYRLHSRQFVGAQVDLAETYQWGLEEVARIEQMMLATAARIRPGASVKEAVAILDADPKYTLHGTDELQRWMQSRADAVLAELADVHFDIPEPVRRIECCIAPTHDGGIYYTGPSEDFSRPGRMWWSVPDDVTEFSTWRELTTVYHEGVPGHHLQIAQTAYRGELLNRWRRHGCWVSGHGEGWALYSEWLMADLGYMDDPGDRLGLLDGQMLRAVRVVIDIGVHCGFKAPELVGGGEWTFEKAWEYFNHYVNMDEAFGRFEVNRYFGWPGQAPSYKLGEQLWLRLRDEVREREGQAFDLKSFHRRALDVGAVGLDVLRQAVLDGSNPAYSQS